MEKFSNEELLEVLPTSLRESKELTTKQKVVLGQLVVYNGLEIVKKDGYFYRSNKDLCADCDIQEKTLIAALNKLVMLGFIERISGSRKDGASLYRINQKLIADYCKTSVDDNCKKDIEDDSNDYSKILTSMHVRITELEITVKRLVERITAIEGRNYSTEADIDKEIDKEKELNNNILNSNSLNNIIEETNSNQELKTSESENSKPNQSQLESNEIPTEVLVSTTELDNINNQTDTDEPSTINEDTNAADETYVPTDKEKETLKKYIKLVNPHLAKFQLAKTEMELKTFKHQLLQYVNDYIKTDSSLTDWVCLEIDKRVKEYFDSRLDEIKGKHQEEIKNQLKLNSFYASFY